MRTPLSLPSAFLLSAAICAFGVALAAEGGPPVPPAPPTPPAAPAAAATDIAPLDREGLPALSDAGVLALKILRGARRFTSDSVGEGGEVPLEAEAMRVLYREKEADAAFHLLLEDGNATSGLYALSGIWFTDPSGFGRAAALFKKNHGEEPVSTMVGCIKEEKEAAAILDAGGHDPAPARLKDRRQTLREWSEAAKTSDYVVDILGGGWPNLLRRGFGAK